MVTHFVKYYPIAGHNMSMPFCGLDDHENCYMTEKFEEVTCKRCLRCLKSKEEEAQ